MQVDRRTALGVCGLFGLAGQKVAASQIRRAMAPAA